MTDSPREVPELVLLTTEYPFGEKSETFLDSELPVLARRFPKIHLLPSHGSGPARPLPDNVRLVEMEWLERPSGRVRRKALLSRDAASVLLGTVGAPSEWLPWAGCAREYGDRLAIQVLKARLLRDWIGRESLEDAIFYDYWFENSTVALSLLRQEGTIGTAVARAHGFDLHDERWEGRTVPFRRFKIGGLDRVFAVSRFGARYLREKVPGAADRVTVSYLGVRDPSAASPEAAPDDVPLVVSCGSLLPDKRFHLVPWALGRLDRPVRWVHLGDGPERERVEAAARSCPSSVRWELKGHVPNREVLRFYGTRAVSLFVLPSVSEGLPVSLMEAISFGIPLVGMEVHGVPEIVTPETGVLVPADAPPEALPTAVEQALEPGRFDRETVRAFFRSRFDAETNYHTFADALIDPRPNPASTP